MADLDGTFRQVRARAALAAVQSQLGESADKLQKLRRYARGLPALLHTTGLGQVLAMARHDRDPNFGKELSSWLCAVDQPFYGRTSETVLEALVRADQNTYFFAQAEAHVYAEWLKTFAEAYIPPPRHREPVQVGTPTSPDETPGAP